MAVGDTELRGVDNFFNSAGVQLAPLGFGLSTDWELIGKVTETNAASLDQFFGADEYDEIEVTYEIEVVTDVDELYIRLSEDGTTFLSGASDYEFVFLLDQNRGGSSFEVEGNGVAFIQTAFNIGNDANGGATGKFTVRHMTSAFKAKVYGEIVYLDGDATQGTVRGEVGGNRTGTGTAQGVQLLASSGNITGTMWVRGRRSAPAALISQDDWVVIDRSEVSAVADHDVFWDDGTYDQIELTLMGIQVTTDATDILLQFSTDGSTFISSATYDVIRLGANDSGTTTFKVEEFNSTSIILLPSLGNVGDEMGSATTIIYDVANTTKKKMITSDQVTLNSFSLRKDLIVAQLVANNDSIKGLRVDGEGAETFSGTIVVRGRRKFPIGVLKQDWEVIENQALSGNLAEIEFTDIPSSAFDEFELSMKDVDSDTTGNTIVLQFSTDNGATWAAGASDYDYAYDRRNAEAAFAEHRSAAAASIEISQNFGSATDRLLHGTVKFSPLDSGSRKHVIFDMSMINDSGTLRGIDGSGVFVGTGSDGIVTAFRLDLSAGGNFTAGSVFTLRGRRKIA